jgi:hypothetical protein
MYLDKTTVTLRQAAHAADLSKILKPTSALFKKESQGEGGYQREDDEPPLYTAEHISSIYSRNLSMLYDRFQSTLMEYAQSLDWSDGAVTKGNFYVRLAEKSVTTPPAWDVDDVLGQVALESWSEFQRLTHRRAGLDSVTIRTARDELRWMLDSGYDKSLELLKDGIQFDGRLLGIQMPQLPAEHREKASDALNVGTKLYRIPLSPTPCALFAVFLPIVDVENRAEYLVAAAEAVDAMEARLIWYHYAEESYHADLSDIDAYRRCIALWSAGA